MKHEHESLTGSEILTQLHSGKLLVVNSQRKNGLILYKDYHAEFAGPGAAVGGQFDLNCQRVLPVGRFSVIEPKSHEDRQKAYLIRRQWTRLTRQLTEEPEPLQRAHKILTQFEAFFDAQTVAQLPDEAFALLIGVLPQTVGMARRSGGDLDDRGRFY